MLRRKNEPKATKVVKYPHKDVTISAYPSKITCLFRDKSIKDNVINQAKISDGPEHGKTLKNV